MDGEVPSDLQVHLRHDDDAEIYINGILAARAKGHISDYEQIPLSEAALKSLKPTGNIMAVHCRQTFGGQYIDVGLATVEPATN